MPRRPVSKPAIRNYWMKRKPEVIPMRFHNGTPCIPWCGTVTEYGYGRVYVDGRQWAAHRLVYEAHHGPVPNGRVLDHLCRNRACVNPAHLELVTLRENTKRGISPTAENVKKTECKMGHPLSGANLRIMPRTGYRQCRECLRRLCRGYRARDKAALANNKATT